MAKRARAKPIPNTVSPEVVNSILDRWDAVQEERASDLGVYRAKCKEHKQAETDLLTEAKARGVNPKLLKKDIKVRGHRRSIREIEAEVEAEFEAEWQAIVEATKSRDSAAPEVERTRAATKKQTAAAVQDFENLH